MVVLDIWPYYQYHWKETPAPLLNEIQTKVKCKLEHSILTKFLSDQQQNLLNQIPKEDQSYLRKKRSEQYTGITMYNQPIFQN